MLECCGSNSIRKNLMRLDEFLAEERGMASYFLPTLQPGKTIYGRCSTVFRMAHLSGEKSSARVLLGAGHAGSLILLPICGTY